MDPTEDANDPEAYPSDADVEALLYEFKGDARVAIRALLHDLAVLAEDALRQVSRGYVRGQVWTLKARRGGEGGTVILKCRDVPLNAQGALMGR